MKVAVASNAQLERDYAAARGTETKPILLVVDGHFAVEPNPDTGAPQKMLVTNNKRQVRRQKNCDD